MLSTSEQWNPSDLYKIDMPQALVEKQKAKAIKLPYDVWERQGKLMATEEKVMHYGFIEKYIERLGERFNIREIALTGEARCRWCRTLRRWASRTCPHPPRN